MLLWDQVKECSVRCSEEDIDLADLTRQQ